MTDEDLGRLERLCAVRVVEVAGAFVRLGADEQTSDALAQDVLRWREQAKSLEQVERVMNHVHLYDEFDGLAEDEYDAAAVRVFVAWNDALKGLDPAFRVEKYEDYGPTVTIYKRRGE